MQSSHSGRWIVNVYITWHSNSISGIACSVTKEKHTSIAKLQCHSGYFLSWYNPRYHQIIQQVGNAKIISGLSYRVRWHSAF